MNAPKVQLIAKEIQHALTQLDRFTAFLETVNKVSKKSMVTVKVTPKLSKMKHSRKPSVDIVEF